MPTNIGSQRALHAAMLACCTLLLTACGKEQPSPLAHHLPPVENLNILVVSFDALRFDALGIGGNSRGLSPALDKFAQDAVIFEQAYTAAPVTPTSFAAAFSGQWPFKVFKGWKFVGEPTLAQVLKQNGYHTFALLNNVQLLKERNFDRGFDHFQVLADPDEVVLDKALEYLDKSLEKPFFGWVHFISPHTPYDYRAEASHLYDPDYEGPFELSTGASLEVANEADLKRARDLYDGEVFFLDRLFARLEQQLKDSGLLENTLIVITADHGEEFMEHGQLQHNGVWEELVQIPMLLRHPVGRGTRTTVPYVNVDLMPTLLSIAAIKTPEIAFDGADLTQKLDSNRVLLAVGMTHSLDRHYSVRMNNKKLIVDCKPEYREQLFFLDEDPQEQVDRLADDPQLAETLLDIAATLAQPDPCSAIEQAIAGKESTTNLTEEQIENLKSLGYIQ